MREKEGHLWRKWLNTCSGLMLTMMTAFLSSLSTLHWSRSVSFIFLLHVNGIIFTSTLSWPLYWKTVFVHWYTDNIEPFLVWLAWRKSYSLDNYIQIHLNWNSIENYNLQYNKEIFQSLYDVILTTRFKSSVIYPDVKLAISFTSKQWLTYQLTTSDPIITWLFKKISVVVFLAILCECFVILICRPHKTGALFSGGRS